MKYLLLFSIFIYSCAPTKKVYDPHVPHPGDTKIILKRVVPIDSIELALFERGYTINTKNKDLGIISTEERKLKGLQGAVKIRAQIKQDEILFTGEFAINYDITLSPLTLKRTFEQVRNGGMNKSIMKESFHAVANVAKQLGGEIIYTK